MSINSAREPIVFTNQPSQTISGFYGSPTSTYNNNNYNNNVNSGWPSNQETFGEIPPSLSNDNNSDNNTSSAAYIIAFEVVFSVFVFGIVAGCYVFGIRRRKRHRQFQREMEQQYAAAQAACSESMLERALERHERRMVRHLHMLRSSSRQSSSMTETTQYTVETSSTVIATERTTNNLLSATGEPGSSMHNYNNDPPRYWPPDPTLRLPEHAVARFSQALLMSHLARAAIPISNYYQMHYCRNGDSNSNNRHRSSSVDSNNNDSNVSSSVPSPLEAFLQRRDGLPKYSELIHPYYQHHQSSSLSLPEDMPPPHQEVFMSRPSSIMTLPRLTRTTSLPNLDIQSTYYPNT